MTKGPWLGVATISPPPGAEGLCLEKGKPGGRELEEGVCANPQGAAFLRAHPLTQ